MENKIKGTTKDRKRLDNWGDSVKSPKGKFDHRKTGGLGLISCLVGIQHPSIALPIPTGRNDRGHG